MYSGKTGIVEKVCGACKECCTVLAVKEDDVVTPRGNACSKLCSTGCGIYDTRPAPCKTYRCLWLASRDMPVHLRPDKSGVVMHHVMVEAKAFGPSLAGLLVFESRPDALKQNPEIQNYIQSCTRDMPIFFVSPASVRILTSSRFVGWAKKYVEANGDTIEDVYVFDQGAGRGSGQ